MRNKEFRLEFEYFWKRIFEEKKITYFSKYADGEVGLMQGKSFNHTNQIDGWISEGFNKFNEDLVKTLNHVENDYFYGISCQCCDINSKQYLLTHLKCPEDRLSYANLWINGNYNEFKNRLNMIAEEVVLIANSSGINKKYPFQINTYFQISNQMVEDWKTNRTTILSSFIRIINQLEENPLVLFAAGPLSEILIDCAYTVKKGRFIDIGSALDEFIFDRKTRPYMVEGSELNLKMCNL